MNKVVLLMLNMFDEAAASSQKNMEKILTINKKDFK